MTFSLVDIFFIILIFLCAVICCAKGFIKVVFGQSALVLGIWVAVLFYKKIFPYMDKLIHHQYLSIILSFILLFLIVYLFVMIIRQCIGNVFEGEIFGGLDKTLGLIFGLIEGLAIVAVIFVVLAVQPWFDLSSIMNNSFFYRIIRRSIAVPVNTISNIVALLVNEAGRV